VSGEANPTEAKRALLLIDFQRDFLRDDGRMPVDAGQREPVVAAANRAAAAARASGDAVIAIGNEFRRGDWGNLFRRFAALAGSEGARWDERVAIDGARYFAKWRGSAFCNADLAPCLDELRVMELALAGVYASACVSATARDALKRGFRVTVLSDAVADRSDATRERALARLARAGATIAETTAVIARSEATKQSRR
jgi:nicotinamidase-related amidase